MIYISDLNTLIAEWVKRMEDPIHPFAYRTAMAECVFELNNLISKQLDNISEEHDKEVHSRCA